MNILHIDSSIQGDQSVTRSLSAAIVTHLRKHQPHARVTYRDVAAAPLPQFSTDAFVADPAPASTGELAAALEEALAADVIVIGAPMYNFGVPSQLKSWLDALAIPGRTFRYSEQGVEGLLGEKRVIVASARGGFYGPESPMATLEHQESHLRAFFGFLGVTRLDVVSAEGVRISPERADVAMRQAMAQVEQLQAA
jgi:FMN-dependent NADH-azoreductase